MAAAVRRRWLAPALAVVSGLAGCSEAGKIVRVDIADLVFSPVEVHARVGDTVEWINKDLFDHTATMPDKEIVIAAGATGKLALTRAGELDYICRFHPDMKGRIVVAPR